MVKIKEKNLHNVNLIINRLKKALNVSEDYELAKVLETTPGAISNWRGRNEPGHKTIIKICLEKNISLDYIFGLKNDYEDYIFNEEGETYIKKSLLEERITKIELLMEELKLKGI
jgi:transcriptional regulator with XRE-family HTH domain